MLRFAEGREVVLMTGYVDLRKGIDGLGAYVKGEYGLDPCANAIYLFCGRRADRFKCLCYDKQRGFILIYLRLEGKGHFQWPRNPQEAKKITTEQYRRLLEGLQVEEKSTLELVERTDMF